MEVPCPLCESPLSGKDANEIIATATKHVNELHEVEELEPVLSHVRGIIRNLPASA
jgi:transcription initiation factor IIE alpha subunit